MWQNQCIDSTVSVAQAHPHNTLYLNYGYKHLQLITFLALCNMSLMMLIPQALLLIYDQLMIIWAM